MNQSIIDHLDQVLSHLYINPLEKCNLRCKICYTKKTSPILSEAEILGFIDRYREVHPLEVVTFCGGEVFTLPYITGLINKLTEIFIQVITNGTVDQLEEIENPNMINLIVSLDGMRDYHDENRGKRNFDKSINFLKKAIKLGFHTEIFSIVTKQNYDRIEEFEKFINNELGLSVTGSRNMFGMTPIKIRVTYHPRKPSSYLLHHPVSNIEGMVAGFDYLNDQQMREIMKNRKTFPPKELGCYQIALVADGSVYGCCEGTVPLGKMSDKIEILFRKLRGRLGIWERQNKIKECLGCSQPDFVCGIKKYLL